jgi:hypothetical protein
LSLETIGETAKGETSEGKERRLSHRFSCGGFAEVYANNTGNLFRGEIRDISQTGCFIKTSVRLKLERLTEVDVVFMLNKRSYRTLARVMNVRPGKGVGLEFVLCEPRTAESIKELLQVLADEASLKQAPSENAETKP